MLLIFFSFFAQKCETGWSAFMRTRLVAFFEHLSQFNEFFVYTAKLYVTGSFFNIVQLLCYYVVLCYCRSCMLLYLGCRMWIT